MPSIAVDTRREQARRWTHGVAIHTRFGARRSLPLAHAANSEVIVERVLQTAQVEGAMHDQLLRVLRVTVQDWLRK